MTSVLSPSDKETRAPHRSHWFRVPIAAITVLVAGLVAVSMLRLAVWSWEKYGAGILSYYGNEVFGNPVTRTILRDTAIAVVLSCALATLFASVLAWLNERTEASIGMLGRVLPLVPFFMPAIALPLGWVYLTAPGAGMLNVALRSGLERIGVTLEQGPLNIYSWPGMIMLYTVWLGGFAYIVMATAMRNLDGGLEEAGKVTGANPVTIFVRIVLPALRPAMLSSFLLCLIPAVAMVSVPITIGSTAGIDVLAVHIVRLVTTQFPPAYEEAFLLGLLLLLPILITWLVQRRTALTGRIAVIGGRASSAPRLRLGTTWRRLGRAVFLGYVFVAVVLPVAGLLYVSGLTFWSSSWPEQWDIVGNMSRTLSDSAIRGAITWSVVLGVATGVALIVAAQLVSYSQRLFPRFGRIADGLAKTPAGVANILIGIGLLVTFGGAPFYLGGTALLLFIGYFVVYLPFASVVTTGAQQQIGNDMIEAGKVTGASEFRIFRNIVNPLSRSALVAGFLLMFVLVSGDLNISLILATNRRPVVGMVMLDLYEFASFPSVAAFALIVTVVTFVCVGVMMVLLNLRDRRGHR